MENRGENKKMPLVKYYGDNCIIETLEFLRSTGDGGAALIQSPVDEAGRLWWRSTNG